jgi:protoporphyrinogen/coproporphyrinogen III oxidase
VRSPRIVVLGAGISGLVYGFYLRKALGQASITILERSACPGGVIETLATQGHLFELGARGLRPGARSRPLFDFVEELGLTDQLISADHRAQKRFLYCGGQLEEMPTGVLRALRSPITRGALRALWRDLRCKKHHHHDDESVADFATRHFGPQWRESLVDPLITGICGGDITKLSVKALLPWLVDLESRHGSLVKAWWRRPKHAGSTRGPVSSGLMTFQGGMSTLIASVAQHLAGEIVYDAEVTALAKGESGYRINTSDGQSLEADIVVSTLPAYRLSALIAAMDGKLHAALEQIEYAPIAVVPLAYDEQVNTYKGFGYLVPRQERQGILGAYWNDSTFPQLATGRGSSFTVLVGGVGYSDFHARDEAHFIKAATVGLQTHLGIQATPSFAQCKILSKALPQYTIGHNARCEAIECMSPRNLYIGGNYLQGTGIHDLIVQAQSGSAVIARGVHAHD